MPKFSIDELKKDIVFDVALRDNKLSFHTTWGLFSPEKIDDGTYQLIKQIEVGKDDLVLDLGCGYGPIGLALAKETKNKVHMIDKDFVAVEYSKKNAQLNNIHNCEIYLSNGFSNVPDIKFDVIVSNLPAKVSKEFFWIMFEDARKHLKPEGTFYVVVISGLKEFVKRNFKEIFGNYEKLSQDTHIVARAIKET